MLSRLFSKRPGRKHPIAIVAYRGYGTANELHLRGRVLEDKGIKIPEIDDTRRENLANILKRFASTEVARARIRARFQDTDFDTIADQHGYFQLVLRPALPLPADRLWHEVALEFLGPSRYPAGPVIAGAEILVPPPSAKFGVISDIDDTVIHTDAVNLLRMALVVFLGNARTRLPLKGVAAFYRALHKGSGTTGVNPLFYVSNSPWNLYDLLSDFFHLNDIPVGPVLFLRRWGFTRRDQLPTRKRQHKLSSAREILALFPDLPFILIGDSGEKDPEIYSELVGLYPDRIQAVYIRTAGHSDKRPAQIAALAERVRAAGSELILADDTVPLARHAAERGWISAEGLADVAAEWRHDSVPLNPIEQLLGESGRPTDVKGQ
ncbi:MAG: phosphatase domain-containing protein [Thermoflexales bacterium]